MNLNFLLGESLEPLLMRLMHPYDVYLEGASLSIP